jgi:small subunit ribosomal protein S9
MVAVKRDKINGDALGTGRRKTAVARVRVRQGSGNIQVNDRPIEQYFASEQDLTWALEPLAAVNKRGDLDLVIRCNGGGPTGQSGAIRMGIARALVSFDQELFPPMRDNGFLTRDSRMKERKKYGLHGARRGTQFSKR